MLFQSQISAFFKKFVGDYTDAASAARKKETAKRLNFYHGEQLTHLETLLSEMFADQMKLQKLSLNITAKVINNLAAIYRVPPVRELSGSEKDQAIYSAICGASQLDLKLKMASRYAKLLKALLLKVVWRSGHADVDILTGNILDIETGDVPAELKSVLITDFGKSSKPEDVEYSLWKPETWQRLDYRGDVIDSAPNPYAPHLPFVPIFDGVPAGSDFWQPGGEDLILQQEAVNVRLVDLLHILHFQSFGVGYIKNQATDPLTEEGPLQVGPNSLVELQGEKAEIGYVSQKASIQPMLNAIDRLIKWAAVSHGLSANTVSLDSSEASGVAKVWDSVELAEMRVEDKLLWQNFEQELFFLLHLVHNTHSSDKLSDSAMLKVNYADPARPTLSPLDEAQSYETYYKLGVYSPVDIIMLKDKDIRSREEALERLKQIKQEREMLAPPRDEEFNPSHQTLNRE